MKPWFLTVLVILQLAAPLFAAGRSMTVEDLLAIKSVSDPQFSPDGSLVVYVVSELDRTTEKTTTSLWLVPSTGGEPKRLTTTPGTNNHPRWRPDGKSIAFVSSRGGSSQVWLLPIDGGEPHQLTKLPIDVSGPIWSPQGDKIAFVAEVHPGQTPEKSAEIDKHRESDKSKVRTFDRLMIRHWKTWDEGKRSHLFVADARTGEARDLTPKLQVNTPPAPFGGSSDYAWSHDGKELAFTAEPSQDNAWSTNTDIWTVPVDGGEPKNITEENHGADAQPAYAPDGRWLAFLRQTKPGFESDLWVLTLRDRQTGKLTELTRALDRPVLSFAWGPASSRTIIATIDHEGTVPIVGFVLDEAGAAHVGPKLVENALVRGGATSVFSVSPKGGSLVFVRTTTSTPPELERTDFGSSPIAPSSTPPARLTHHNAQLLSELAVQPAEAFAFPGADHDEIHGWLVRPPLFDPAKKYPVVFLIHGGPQGAWHDEWHSRWNYQMFASPGYAVVAINPRGSTGYGQKFTDQISRDWTGRVYDDLMNGLDYVVTKYPFLDGARVAAAGGSYGGFMVNWIAGHTDRFKALISHAGVFDLTSKYGTTEELWFPEWEFGGPPWENAEHYRERSPSTYAAHFKTPTLVIHGALDFRVHEAQGLGMFTSLQRRGVPSRYVWFPDEGHWILQPQNRAVWWHEVLGWLNKYLKN